MGKRLMTYTKDYVVFDLETTGVSTAYDEVIEISALRVRDGAVVEEFSSLVRPTRSIPFQATQINGISDRMVKNSPMFDVVLASFLEFVGEDILVGHNITTFDLKFIERDAQKLLGRSVDNDYIDTLTLARACLPGQSRYALGCLAQHYGISSEGAHRALFDCKMNQAIFEKLGEEMAKPTFASLGFKSCPRCGNVLKKRTGRFGDFWGCAGYPECKYTQNA